MLHFNGRVAAAAAWVLPLLLPFVVGPAVAAEQARVVDDPYEGVHVFDKSKVAPKARGYSPYAGGEPREEPRRESRKHVRRQARLKREQDARAEERCAVEQVKVVHFVAG